MTLSKNKFVYVILKSVKYKSKLKTVVVGSSSNKNKQNFNINSSSAIDNYALLEYALPEKGNSNSKRNNRLQGSSFL